MCVGYLVAALAGATVGFGVLVGCVVDDACPYGDAPNRARGDPLKLEKP